MSIDNQAKFGRKYFKRGKATKYSPKPKWKTSLLSHNGQLQEECIYLTWDDLNISNRLYQTRKFDLDKGHIAQLQGSIEGQGLHELPTVEYDPNSRTFEVLTGFHRFHAMAGLGWEDFPAAVVSFDDPIKRYWYLLDCNQHLPAKGHGIEDAVVTINHLDAMGYFPQNLTDGERRKWCDQVIDRRFADLKRKKKKIFDKSSLSDGLRFKTWTMAMARHQASKFWEVDVASVGGGNVHGDTCFVAAPLTVYGNAVKTGISTRLKAIQSKRATNPLDIKVMIHIPTDGLTDERLVKDREKVKEEMALWNQTCFRSGKYAKYSELVFLPQVMAPVAHAEVDPIQYTWRQNEWQLM